MGFLAAAGLASAFTGGGCSEPSFSFSEPRPYAHFRRRLQPLSSTWHLRLHSICHRNYCKYIVSMTEKGNERALSSCRATWQQHEVGGVALYPALCISHLGDAGTCNTLDTALTTITKGKQCLVSYHNCDRLSSGDVRLTLSGGVHQRMGLGRADGEGCDLSTIQPPNGEKGSCLSVHPRRVYGLHPRYSMPGGCHLRRGGRDPQPGC
ncbi:hypothetical protein BJX63DRAFT_385376 [Aspergillus granulosus]|uniref:Uncharacterized protein n=1 Tax=Aspergillus granulosus TaxID=176169 RepID=A0ABR4HQC3_9EURO